MSNFGEIIPKDALMVRRYIGDAESGEGKEYMLCLGVGNIPVISSKLTGKSFSLSWHDIITMATEAGIDIDEGVRDVESKID